MINRVKVVLAGNEDCNILKARNEAYSCVFDYKGKRRMITEDGQYKEINLYDPHPPRPLLINWGKTMMYHAYAYEADVTKQNDQDRNNHKIVELFWKVCPLVGDFFKIIDSNTKVAAATNRFDDILKAANKLKSMTYAEICDVAHYYGKSPDSKSEEELRVELGDFQTGYCMLETVLPGFLKTWVDGKSDDREVIVILKKAISYGIIKNMGQGTLTNYYVGESFMGVDEPGMIDWSRKNPRDYKEHIERLVEEKDKVESAEEKSVKKQKTVDLNQLDELKRLAKELKIEGFIEDEVSTHTMGFAKLKPIVDAAMAKKNDITV